MRVDPTLIEVVEISNDASKLFEAHTKRKNGQSDLQYLFVDARKLHPIRVVEWIKDLYEAEDKAQASGLNVTPLPRIGVLTSSHTERHFWNLPLSVTVVATPELDGDPVAIFGNALEEIWHKAMQPPLPQDPPSNELRSIGSALNPSKRQEWDKKWEELDGPGR